VECWPFAIERKFLKYICNCSYFDFASEISAVYHVFHFSQTVFITITNNKF